MSVRFKNARVKKIPSKQSYTVKRGNRLRVGVRFKNASVSGLRVGPSMPQTLCLSTFPVFDFLGEAKLESNKIARFSAVAAAILTTPRKSHDALCLKDARCPCDHSEPSFGKGMRRSTFQ